MQRRQFIILTAATLAGCASQTEPNAPPVLRPAAIDAGSAADYKADGVYDRFHDSGFFIVRRGEALLALSAICTHRHCKLRAQPDRSFYCKCHGSTFDPQGHVTEGPAKLDLPILPTEIDARGHLIIKAVLM